MSFNLYNYHFKSNELFENITNDEIGKLESIKTVRQYNKGEVLYAQGSLASVVYRLKRGKIKIEQLNTDGRIRIIYIYVKGECFGFRTLFSNEKNPVSAIFLEDGEVEIYEGKKYLRIIKESVTLSSNLIQILSYEFNVWINFISSLSHKTARAKVALVLLILSEKYKNDNPPAITMTKLDMARYSDTTEETVVRVISFFVKQRLLTNDGRSIQITNIKLLEMIAEGY
jgi:CRP/FNR family transcriptional regulator